MRKIGCVFAVNNRNQYQQSPHKRASSQQQRTTMKKELLDQNNEMLQAIEAIGKYAWDCKEGAEVINKLRYKILDNCKKIDAIEAQNEG